MLLGWVHLKPSSALNEVAASLARKDVEPRFFTYQSFSDYGSIAASKFTDPYYGVDKPGVKYDVKAALAEEIHNNDVFEKLLELILDGITSKEEVRKELKKEFKGITDETVENFWIYVKEEAVNEDDYGHYMMNTLQGSLWLREAFLQAQVGLRFMKMPVAMMITMMLSLFTFVMVCFTNATNARTETLQEWYAQTTGAFWAFNIIVAMLYLMYVM